MKKKKKAYFSKTFIYLVLLIATVAGFFLMVNYATNQKLSLNSEATGGGTKCKQNPRADWYKLTSKIAVCSDISKEYKDKRAFTRVTPDGSYRNGYICCAASNIAGANINRGKNCRQAGGTDWYSGTDDEIKKGYNSKYKVTVTNKSSGVGKFYQDQNKDKRCLKVVAKLKPTCQSLSGKWMKSCTITDGYYYNYTNPNRENLADYKQGKVCCKKGSKKVVEPKPEPQ